MPTGGGPPGPPGAMDVASLPPPPPGFVPPPLREFDANGDGSLDKDEWDRARDRFARTGFPGPGPGPGGPSPFGPPGAISERLLGSHARYFTLSHLWFLWYLLVFASTVPWIAMALERAARLCGLRDADARFGEALRRGTGPLVLGLLSVPALLATAGPFGWSLGMASGIGRGFPDFLLRLEPDMPFYLVYFLAGWWLHRTREMLPEFANLWLPHLAIGLVAHALASVLSGAFAGRVDLPHSGLIRLAGFALYAVGSAYTAAGFLGVFQRYFDRPSRAWTYMAETAFWVYLVHQPLLAPFLKWLVPLGMPWWLKTLLASSLCTGAALLLYELLVRPTPLVRWLGPGRALKLARSPERVPGGREASDDRPSLATEGVRFGQPECIVD
ncbi:MAG: acyltransferase family protein [Isosphaeraceae bacterium]